MEAHESWQRVQTEQYDEFMRGTLARMAHLAASFGRLAVEGAVDAEITNNTRKAEQIQHNLAALHATHNRS